MYRAERTSSKLCRDRELEAAKVIHHKKLGETRSAIDTTKPKTSSMHHMMCNKRKNRLVEERMEEIEKHNNLLVNRMADVLNCSTWEFHPSTSVEDVSYTVYHSPRHSPRKPSAPSPAKKSLNDTFRTKKLKQIQAENEVHEFLMLRTTSTHYKTTKLQREWKQSVKYLKSICAYPLMPPSKGQPENDRFDYPPLRPLLLRSGDGDVVDQDDLLEFYSMSLPTIITPILENKLPAASSLMASHYSRGRQSKHQRPSFQPQRVGKRPGLPSLDPLSPRFKWGPNGSPYSPHNAPPTLSLDPSYNFKQCRVIEGVYFVLTVKSGRSPYGMTVVGYDGETCRSYELVVSKEHVLKLLRDCISIREEFSVETISRLLCDKLQFVPHVLYIPLDDASPSSSCSSMQQSSIFCMFHEVPIVPSLPPFLVSMASTEDGGVLFCAEHPITRRAYVLTKSGLDIVAYLHTKATTPAFSTLEAAAVAVLSYLVLQNGLLTWQLPPPKRVCVFKSARQLGHDYYLLHVCHEQPPGESGGHQVVVAYNADECASLELVLPSHVDQVNWESVLDSIVLDVEPVKCLRYAPPPSVAVPVHEKEELLVPPLRTTTDSVVATNKDNNKAAATIQATMRAALCRRLYLEKLNAAHVIKTSCLRRLYQKKRTKKRQHQIVLCSPLRNPPKGGKAIEEAAAAVTIQKVVRGSICRHAQALRKKRPATPMEVRQSCDNANVDKSVSVLQARFRGAQTRQKVVKLQQEQENAAKVLQARMRGTLARNHIERHHR
ncbi:hypothetical protein DYB37_008703 [Aphanomyces astaci]|uniref:Uncharacterized protein n=1 Tax=Aphanomyces astaci TaxID=112090 RepID=A0A3R7B498_APHAT|nr:hypothetical protein DYB37_008703 [Aphanomyces astaci]